jgi:hypothetical protein
MFDHCAQSGERHGILKPKWWQSGELPPLP